MQPVNFFSFFTEKLKLRQSKPLEQCLRLFSLIRESKFQILSFHFSSQQTFTKMQRRVNSIKRIDKKTKAIMVAKKGNKK